MIRLTHERLYLEIMDMMSKYKHTKLYRTPDGRIHWQGYVKKGKKKYHFIITYPDLYPQIRPIFYPVEIENGRTVIAEDIVNLHPYGSALCLYTHDTSENSWDSSLYASDSISRFIEYIEGKRHAIADLQDLNERLNLPGFRSYDYKYIINEETYNKLQELNKNQINIGKVREDPLLLLIEKTDENETWFHDEKLYQILDHNDGQISIKTKFKDIKLNWKKTDIVKYFNLTDKEDISTIVLIPEEKEVEPAIIELEPELKNYKLNIFNQKLLFKRIEDVYLNERKLLSDIKVMIIGLGSLGAPLTISLAKSGIEELYLYDPDILNPENIIRHTGTIKDLYKYKTDILKEQIYEINPEARVNAFNYNPLKEGKINEFITALAKVDLVILTFAVHDDELALNKIIFENNKPMVFSEVLGHGSYGRIFRVIPNKTSCFKCFDMHNAEDQERYPTLTEDKGYDIPRREGYDDPSIPGIGIDIQIISLLTARFTLQTLFEFKDLKESTYPKTETDHIIWANDKGWIFTDPLITQSINYPIHEKCDICHPNLVEHKPVSQKDFEEAIKKATDPARIKE